MKLVMGKYILLDNCIIFFSADVTEESLMFKSCIEEFLCNETESVLSFPASLSSYQRMLIHNVSVHRTA